MAVVHRVYAEALLEAAKDEKRLDRVRKEFDDFATAVEGSNELRSFLANPQIESQSKSAALEELLTGADELLVNFVRLLAEKNRIAEAVQVHEEWERLLARE
ncbi:MAG TPA: F0F1 ATP synthase subunit delta, partial [Gaiellaceae bacterium]